LECSPLFVPKQDYQALEVVLAWLEWKVMLMASRIVRVNQIRDFTNCKKEVPLEIDDGLDPGMGILVVLIRLNAASSSSSSSCENDMCGEVAPSDLAALFSSS
jgi:hypothetical protein